MNKKITFLAMMSLSLVGGLGLASCSDNNNDLDDVVDEHFAALDVNGDLVVTQTEFNNGFAVFDTDSDQVLTVGEFGFNGNLFDIADVNHDGVVTEAEWDNLLAAIDINNNGIIEESELAPFF